MPPLPPNIPPHLQQLFLKPGGTRYGANLALVGKGSLIKFNYVGIPNQSQIHDFHPVVIVYSLRGQLVKGVNIRYLTFPYIRALLGGNPQNCDNPNISYTRIKSDRYITEAFRSYKRVGMKMLRKLDCGFLLKVLGEMRSFSPSEIELMRTYVRQALKNLGQPRATRGAREYKGWFIPTHHTTVMEQNRPIAGRGGEAAPGGPNLGEITPPPAI